MRETPGAKPRALAKVDVGDHRAQNSTRSAAIARKAASLWALKAGRPLRSSPDGRRPIAQNSRPRSSRRRLNSALNAEERSFERAGPTKTPGRGRARASAAIGSPPNAPPIANRSEARRTARGNNRYRRAPASRMKRTRETASRAHFRIPFTGGAPATTRPQADTSYTTDA
jgi:hypothetical protein